MYSPIAVLGLDCWQPIQKLFLKSTALTAIVVTTLCSGCTKSTRTFEEMTEVEQLNFLRAQADNALLAQATDNVPNIHAVIEENADTFSDSVQQWRGWVRLDYQDRSGGIQQTNIPMTFVATFDGHLLSRAAGVAGSPLLNIQ